MASPSLFLSWPQEDSPTPPPPPKSRPKPKRASKSSSMLNSKKIPQRGLGVAKLEQIRLQNNKISFVDGGQIEPFPVNQLPASMYAAPVVTYAGSVRCLPQFRLGYGPVSTIQSVLQEQYALDQDRARAGTAAGELPSNQRVCVSSSYLCQLCARKKRVLSEDMEVGGNGALLSHYFAAMDEEWRNLGCVERMMGPGLAKEREIKEYDFFNGSGRDLVFDERAVDGPSPSSTGAAANYVDLSLKLF